MTLRINATTRPQFAGAGQFARWSVVSKVNNLRPERPARRHNAAYIRRSASQLSTRQSLILVCAGWRRSVVSRSYSQFCCQLATTLPRYVTRRYWR